MYIKLDILSFLIYFIYNSNNTSEVALSVNKYNDKIITQFIYIMLEDLIQLNDISFNYYKSIEEDPELNTFRQEYIEKLLEKNDINMNLIELNLKMLDLFLNNSLWCDIIIGNKHILENISLSLTHIIFNNLPKKLIHKFPKIHKYKNILPESSLFSLLLKVITNSNLIDEPQFLTYNCNNKLFSIKDFRDFYEDQINHYVLTNNYYRFIANISQNKKMLQQKQKEIEYPAEFYDPIMDCISRNPVILPSSKTIRKRCY